MAKIVPIRGKFENACTMLHAVAEDETIEQVAVLTISKGGGITYGQFGMTRANLAYASVVIAKEALADD